MSPVGFTQDCSSSNKKIKILMVSLPKHGVLTWRSSASDHKELKENSSFTIEDINHQRIWYTLILVFGGPGIFSHKCSELYNVGANLKIHKLFL